jgi:hypothetical protein
VVRIVSNGDPDHIFFRGVLINHRALNLALLFLITSRTGNAAVPTEFAPLTDDSSVVWSLAPMSKSDVVEVHAFKAPPGMLVYLGICNDKCADTHEVKRIPVNVPLNNSVSEKYTLEESGHLVLWAVQPPRLELNPGASKAISQDSANPVAGVVHSGFSGLYNGAEVMHAHKIQVETDEVKLRFDAGCYVTLRRLSAVSP